MRHTSDNPYLATAMSAFDPALAAAETAKVSDVSLADAIDEVTNEIPGFDPTGTLGHDGHEKWSKKARKAYPILKEIDLSERRVEVEFFDPYDFDRSNRLRAEDDALIAQAEADGMFTSDPETPEGRMERMVVLGPNPHTTPFPDDAIERLRYGHPYRSVVNEIEEFVATWPGSLKGWWALGTAHELIALGEIPTADLSEKAAKKRHRRAHDAYRAGVAMAEVALVGHTFIDDERFTVQTGPKPYGAYEYAIAPWVSLRNRALLRCLLGVAEYQWDMRNNAEARKIFVDMMWLNPNDNQGIRDLLHCLDDGLTYRKALKALGVDDDYW